MVQICCDRDRPRDLIYIQISKWPNIIFPFELGHFEVCTDIQSCGLSLSNQFWVILRSLYLRGFLVAFYGILTPRTFLVNISSVFFLGSASRSEVIIVFSCNIHSISSNFGSRPKLPPPIHWMASWPLRYTNTVGRFLSG